MIGTLREYCKDCKDSESMSNRIFDYLGSTGYEITEEDADFIHENDYALSDFDGEYDGDYIIVVMDTQDCKRYMLACEHNLQKQADILLGKDWSHADLSPLLSASSMDEFNYALRGFGVECICSISGENDFECVNRGDGYSMTIVSYKGEYIITHWADIVENNMEDFQ